MIYRVLGLMSGSSLDGLDIAFVEFEEKAGKWTFSLLESECVSYSLELEQRLASAPLLSAVEFMQLNAEYGHFLGNAINQFIHDKGIGYKVALICSHGHTIFHEPGRFTSQIGDGAAIAAVTGLPVVTDLRSMDVALGGQGAPIVPIGEKLLFNEHALFLNIGGIANISHHQHSMHRAFDVCPANKVLNMLSMRVDKKFDQDGELASSGIVHEALLKELNQLSYYQLPFPKSLANEFGSEVVYPLIVSFGLSISDSLATYVEHIAIQVSNAIVNLELRSVGNYAGSTMVVTGGGAFNSYLVSRIQFHLSEHEITIEVPSEGIVQYKEAIIMALLGVLRWREEDTVISSVTGSSRSSIGGALWMGAH
jgi:anhydro-N-acetylmuramic acid kinase